MAALTLFWFPHVHNVQVRAEEDRSSPPTWQPGRLHQLAFPGGAECSHTHMRRARRTPLWTTFCLNCASSAHHSACAPGHMYLQQPSAVHKGYSWVENVHWGDQVWRTERAGGVTPLLALAGANIFCQLSYLRWSFFGPKCLVKMQTLPKGQVLI